jgi:hypothetical protein
MGLALPGFGRIDPTAAVPPVEAVQQPDPANPLNQFAGVITQVRREDKAIVVNDRTLGEQKMLIGPQTKIYHGDKNGTFDDLKVGVSVDGTSRGTPGSMYVETINISLGL